MKKPLKVRMPQKPMEAGGPPTKEKDGKHKKTGVNKPVKKESAPQIVATTRYGQPTPTQKR